MNLTNRICSVLLVLFLSACGRDKSLFEIVDSSDSKISFSNMLEKKEGFGILYYLYYYNGGGVATGDINNDGLPDIYFTANSLGNNKLYLNKGNLQFEDITENAKVFGTADWCSGVTMADVNGDGWLDIYVSAVSQSFGLNGKNQLYINNGNNTFTDRAAEYGLDFAGFSTQAAFFDYDHDGDLDCYLLNQSHSPNSNIVDTSNRRKVNPLAGDRLYRNEYNSGKKFFTDVSAEAGIYQSILGYGLGLAVADLNNDGWEDIYVGNDFHENDYYYINNGNGSFSESAGKHFGHFSRFSMGNDIADFNNDGMPDIITADMLPDDEKVLKTYGSDENPDIYKFKLARNGYLDQYSRNSLQINNGNGSSFSEVALISGVSATDWSWSTLFADFDKDGNKDLLITSGIVKRPVDLDYVRFVSDLYMKKKPGSGTDYDEMALEKMPDGSSHPFLFKGSGGLHFTNLSEDWGVGKMDGYYTGASYADLDNDGDLDLVINALNAESFILKNTSSSGNYLSIALKGANQNSAGIGSKIYLFNEGKIQYQQLMATRGFQSSSDPRFFFGLDTLSVIDSLLIVWPNQTFQLVKSVQANQLLTLDESEASGEFDSEAYLPKSDPLLTIIPSSTLSFGWKHKENNFVDFNIQYLLPHALSTRGPKLAVADVNGDGADDFYACGAKGQAGALMIQQENGTFIQLDSNLFNKDVLFEDVDAIFFDANGDGHPDLYIVSGGNEYPSGSEWLADRLYINDGKGHFSRSLTLPVFLYNKSCVAAADIDRDGDQDLFVGNLADPNAYGKPQTSFLLINDGKARFSVSSENQIPLKQLGMVTSAAFADLDKNGYPELVVAGEWMPITVFNNSGGNFSTVQLPNSSGWWQSVYLKDVNQDGKIDLLAGNWGYNNKFHEGKTPPLKLYVSDFDNNGQTDQLLSYNYNGQEYPFLAKDEVERALPLLKKHYLNYADYAGLPMKEVFYGWVDTIKPLEAEMLGSVLGIGDGKGGFALNPLPTELQMAPVFSFCQLDKKDRQTRFITGGNFYDVIPYEGRYDAQSLSVFSVGNDNQITVLKHPNLKAIQKQFRSLQPLRAGDSVRYFLGGTNNSEIILLEPANLP